MSHKQCICAECEYTRRDAERYRWVRKAGAFDSEIGLDMLSEDPTKYDAAVDEYRGVCMGDGSTANCKWTRLPDSERFLDLARVRFSTQCSDKIAVGAHAIYPDKCPSCGKVVVIAARNTEVGK